MKILFLANSHDSLLSGIDFARLLNLRSGGFDILLTHAKILNHKYIEDANSAGARILVADPPQKKLFSKIHCTDARDLFICETTINNDQPHRTAISGNNASTSHNKLICSQCKLFAAIFLRRLREVLFVIHIAKTIKADIVAMRYCVTGSHNVIWAKLGKIFGYKSIAYTNTHTLSGLSLVPAALAKDARHHVAGLAFIYFIKLFPKWGKTWAGGKLSRLPLAKSVTEQILGLALGDPWKQLNIPPLNGILVESEVMRSSICAMNNGDPGNVIAVGSYALDRMAEIARTRQQRRTQLLETFGLADDRPILLCALPPAERFPKRSLPELPTFDSLMRLWFDNLARIDFWNIVITPHPRLDISAIKVEHPRTLITNFRALELIPLCDCFLSAGSTTSRWAKAYGIPTINFDCFNTFLEDEHESTEHYHTNNSQQLVSIFEAISSHEKIASLTRTAVKNSDKWGIIDGQSKYRVMNALKKITESEKLC